MEVRLTPDQEAYVREMIASGRYGAPEEVVAEALRALRREPSLSAEERARFEATLVEAEAEIERGDGVSGEQMIAELRALSPEHRAKSA